jgi:glutathione S-transferase
MVEEKQRSGFYAPYLKAAGQWHPGESPAMDATAFQEKLAGWLGERFSAADVLYGTTFALFAGNALLQKSTVIEDYAKRVVARPAFARAQARDALAA